MLSANFSLKTPFGVITQQTLHDHAGVWMAATAAAAGAILLYRRRRVSKHAQGTVVTESDAAATFDLLTGVFEDDVKHVTHRGACHCGRVKIVVRAPAELDVMNCNCSMCLKKGRVYHLPVPVKAVDFSSGSSDMSVYSYGTDGCKHLFCAICGIHLVNTSRASSSVFDVNVSCLDPRTIKSIAVHSFDGQNFDEAFGVLKAEKEAELALRRSESSVASQKPRGALEPRPALAATLAALHGDSALRPSGPGFPLDASFDDARSVDSSVSRRSDVTLQAPVRIHPAVAVKPLSASNGDGLLISSRSSDDRVKAGNLASLVSGAGSTLPAPISVAADGLGEDQRDDDGASSSGDSDIGAITRQALKRDSRAGGHLAIPVRRSAQYAGQQM